MTKNRKISTQQVGYLKNMPNYTTKKHENSYKPLKDALLQSLVGLFAELEKNISTRMFKVLEEITFRSVEKGFEFVSIETLSEKFEISPKTIYRNFKYLLDAKVLFKKNFSSRKHNGYGDGIYFFSAHPYFEHYNEYFGHCWITKDSDEKANEKANEKAENAEIPCVASDLSDFNAPTYSLPSLDLKEIDLHTNVQEPSPKKKIIKYVPKVINELYANIFDYRLRNVWRKITQAWKTINHVSLDRAYLLEIGTRVIKRISQIWKDKAHNDQEMTVDEMCAFAYKATRDIVYTNLATEYMQDYDCEENAIMGEVVRSIPEYEKIALSVQPDRDYKSIKEHVVECIKWGFAMLSPEALRRIVTNYDRYTTVRYS